MPRRPCLVCGRLHSNPSRCSSCQAQWQAHQDAVRGSSAKRGYGSSWRRIAAAVVATHKAIYGMQCPGYGVPAHTASSLTVDHIVAKANGGTDELSNLRVLCRECNSRKGSSSTTT